MAAPLPGFTPLLLSSLALHLLLLGPLFAFTPGTVNTGGVSNRWIPGLCYRDAGKVSQQQQQHQCEEARESPRGSWNLRPSRWTVERIQREGCSGVQRAGETLRGYLRYGAKGRRKEGPKGVGTFWKTADRPPAPSPPTLQLHPGIRSRLNSDGVGGGERVERGRLGRKGVVSPPTSPVSTPSLVQNGKKRAVQRTRACAQRWPASRPHLAKRSAAGAFVHASGLNGAPGSGGRRGGEVRERAPEVKRLLAAWCSPTHWPCPYKPPLSVASTPSPGLVPAGFSHCIHSLSGYISPQADASNTFKPTFTNNPDCVRASQLDCVCNFHNIQQQLVYRNGNKAKRWDGSVSVNRRAGNCSHLGWHNVIDPNRSRERGDDSSLTGCIRENGGGPRGGGDEGREAYRCSALEEISNLGCWLPPLCEARSKRARVIHERKEREVNDGRGGGMSHSSKHIHLSNYPDNGLAFLILKLSCSTDNELQRGKSAPGTEGQSSQTRRESRADRVGPSGGSGCLDREEMGGGYLAEFTTPEGGIAPRKRLIQIALSSIISETPCQQSPSNKTTVPQNASKYSEYSGSEVTETAPTQTETDESWESGRRVTALSLSAGKVRATSETQSAGDSGFSSPAKFPATSPSHSEAAVQPAAEYLSLVSAVNLTTWSARSLHSPRVEELSARRTAPPDAERVFLWSKSNTNNNNNNSNRIKDN